MRLEATVPDSRGSAIQELADQLGLSRSQVVDEALALFLKAVLEIRRGRRLVTQDPHGSGALCELTTPTLTTLEWVLAREDLHVSEAAVQRLQELIEAPAEPNDRLKAAVLRHRA
jgi:hypothetical protein